MDVGRLLQRCGVIGSIDTLVVLRKFLDAKLMGEPNKPPPQKKRGKFRETTLVAVHMSPETILNKMIQFYKEND
eukprot:COSAG01_NODE_9683_length_2370_cov_13.425363_3_plen_74_part_00